MYKAMDLAKWFIEKGISQSNALTPLQVIKLCYIAQGLHLAVYNQPLFINSIEAWKYGPVIKSVYQELKVFGKNKIEDSSYINAKGINPQDLETINVLEEVFNAFGNKNGLELSAWTHRTGSAWHKAYNDQGGYKYLGFDIDPDLLKEEFSNIVSKHNQIRTVPIFKSYSSCL